MDDFASKFESMLAKEKGAASLVRKIASQGTRREDLILLLDAATDPKGDQTYSKAYAKFKNQLPLRKRILGLAVRMGHLAQEIEEVFGHPIYAVLSKSQRLTEIATLLRTEAVAVREFPRPKIGKLFSLKSLWKHVPVALLCARLDVPQRTSCAAAQYLLWYAFLAREIGDSATSERGLEREPRRFQRSAAGKFFFSLVQKGVNRLPTFRIEVPASGAKDGFRQALNAANRPWGLELSPWWVLDGTAKLTAFTPVT
jgi:hypothetical protein